MAAYTVINGGSALVNVDGSSTNIDEMTYKNTITLDSTHLITLLDGVTFHKNIAVLFDLAAFTDADQLKRVLAIASMYAST